jgi:hypothetical protein
MELANEHRTLRQMLGHGVFDEDKRYGLQTIKDNVSKLSMAKIIEPVSAIKIEPLFQRNS